MNKEIIERVVAMLRIYAETMRMLEVAARDIARMVVIVLIIAFPVSALADGRITLAWDDTNDPPVDSFIIYQNDVEVATVTEKQWVSDILTTGTNYCWFVQSVRGTDRSLPSARLCIVYQDQTVIVVPNRPQQLTIKFAD